MNRRYVVPGVLSAIAVMTLFTLAPEADQTSVSSVEIIVPATSGWVHTGIDLSPYECVSITATASWRPNPQEREVGPMGFAEPCGANCSTCPIYANHGALIGRVGTSGVPFVVGKDFQFIVNNGWSGELQFSINDDQAILHDNSGSATVHIDLLATPVQHQTWGGLKSAYR